MSLPQNIGQVTAKAHGAQIDAYRATPYCATPYRGEAPHAASPTTTFIAGEAQRPEAQPYLVQTDRDPPRIKARVVIIQEQLKQYRLPLFSQLAAALAAEHIELTVLYSHPNQQEAQKSDHRQVDERWGQVVPITHWRHLTWQRLPCSQLHQADLLIIEQANRHLANWGCWLRYRLMVMTGGRLRWPYLAFWGHGQDFQRPYWRWRDRLKQRLMTTVHWWFAYTPQVAEAVAAQGMPPHKIVALTNTVDSNQLHTAVKSLRQASEQETSALYRVQARVLRLLFCGALYEHKRLDLLFAAADLLAQAQIPLELTVMGAGPLHDWCVNMCAQRSYATYVGALFVDSVTEPVDVDPYQQDLQQDPRAAYFANADLLVIPGLVGLAIVDGFAADLPLITTDVPYHSPEISYLRSGYNGIMCKPDATSLAATLQTLWQSPAEIVRLRKGVQASYPQLQLPKLVTKFCQGIIAALADANTAADINVKADEHGAGKEQ